MKVKYHCVWSHIASDALYQAIAYIAATQRPTQFYCANTTLYSGNRIPITHVTKTQQCSHRDGLSSADSCLTAYPSINWACHWQLCWCNKQQCHLSHAVTTISHCVHHMWYTPHVMNQKTAALSSFLWDYQGLEKFLCFRLQRELRQMTVNNNTVGFINSAIRGPSQKFLASTY